MRRIGSVLLCAARRRVQSEEENTCFVRQTTKHVGQNMYSPKNATEQ